MQKKYRLKGRKVFNFVLNKGSSVSNKALVLIYAPSKYPIHVGFIVSKKIGHAVTRNKVRRRLRESFRSLIPNIQNNYNYVVIARSGITDLSYDQITQSLIGALKKSNLYKGE